MRVRELFGRARDFKVLKLFSDPIGSSKYYVHGYGVPSYLSCGTAWEHQGRVVHRFILEARMDSELPWNAANIRKGSAMPFKLSKT